ncbi:hypothetical protein ACFQV4_14080 [Streptomyces thermocarboxydus]
MLALARARSRPRAGAMPLIESEVTQLDASGRLAFREVDVSDCADRGSSGRRAMCSGCPTPCGAARPVTSLGPVRRRVRTPCAGP